MQTVPTYASVQPELLKQVSDSRRQEGICIIAHKKELKDLIQKMESISYLFQIKIKEKEQMDLVI